MNKFSLEDPVNKQIKGWDLLQHNDQHAEIQAVAL